MKKNLLIIMLLTFLFVTLILITGCSGTTQAPESTSEQQNSASNSIAIENFVFNPDTIKVPVGTSVEWINKDSAPHTIKAEKFNSDSLSTNDSFKFTFDSPGTYEYQCGIHPSMKGKIIVQ
ncbi:cupredoxin domain-containing protein [Candidatus Formimonas warabiya]|uniref:EfeO-type cupredoxin-like domain-containing protein n=1 Tax=Formimonas warabiya TaxID=1761012 RepID=A0A3G1L0N7_FORW1|nr:cupredoxin family copper-binding protein [Candidatus Formimonas warabiya]ATW28204.1 hypothetical protein DCMF_28685 [Candidatus Formimonas warabiya]